MRFALACILLPWVIGAQTVETDCDPLANLPATQGDVNLFYGSTTNAFSFRNRTSVIVGQPAIGISQNQNLNAATGYWMRFLLPPTKPVIKSSGGDFPDRVLISWEVDPLSPVPDEGFTILRDGAFLATVGPSIRQFIDFNVQAGEFYNYSIFGSNQFGAGPRSTSVGFVNPNGTVSGTVNTQSGNPVPGAIIRLLPTIGNSLSFDGVDDKICISHHPSLPTNMWTLSTWVKIGANHVDKAIIDFGSDINKNFWLHTSSGIGGKGITVGVGNGNTATTLSHAFVTNPDGWHQVAVVYNGTNLLLYVDGEFVNSTTASIQSIASLFSVGSTNGNSKFFQGNIDDVRLYNRPLTATEIFITKDLTPSQAADGLVAYFKFDEGLGEKVFDISRNRLQGLRLGATFSNDAAPVINAAITDAKGFYTIGGVNYSREQNFVATPSKSFYQNFAIEFNAAYQSRVDLTNFDLRDTFTLEMVLHPFDLISRQSILTYGSEFDYYIENGQTKLSLNGQTIDLSPATAAYRHIAFRVINGELRYYENGNELGVYSLNTSTMNFSGDRWRLGSSNAPFQHYFTGLIDEMSVYKDALTIQDIQLHASPVENGGTDIGNGSLTTWFSLDEGDDNFVNDYGAAATGEGTVFNAGFSIITYRQKELVHLFRPSERSVVINTSNTAASGIDFTDESTIPISGVVRFENTFCYQDSVEILVNGERNFPPIFTDAQGRFVADFEPGRSVILTPKYGRNGEEQRFFPPFFEARKINRPIAAVLFANQTKRTIQGQLAGGDSRLSIISPTDLVRVKVAADNQCFERELTLEEADGRFVFRDLPAIPMTTAVTLHTNPTIFEYLQNNGGISSDMRNVARDTVDFRYYAPPQVWVEPFEATVCPNGQSTPYPTIEESNRSNGFRLYRKTLRMYEDYVGGRDWLNNYDLEVINNLNDEAPEFIEVRDTNAYRFEFYAGRANIAGDNTKFIQVKATSPRNQESVEVQRAIVLGERPRETSFITASPEIPVLILRDPFGDASFSSWTKGQTHCQTWSNASLATEGSSSEIEAKLGGKITISKGVGVAVETEAKVSNTLKISTNATGSTTSERSMEFCTTVDQSIETSSGDAVMGDDADLYYGAAVNFRFSANDVLWLNTATCEVLGDSTTVSVFPVGFNTEFVYSQWQILTTVIPNLELAGNTKSAEAWRKIINYNKELKNKANFKKNVSFDGLASFTEGSQTSTSNSLSIETEVTFSAEVSNELGFEVNENGLKSTMKLNFGGGFTENNSFTNSKNTATSYTFADDDPNDSYTVDILDDPVYGTPVFRLRAGESMCPWVPGTLNREEIGFQIDRLSAVDVPETQAAIFRVTMSNLGQTGRDPLVYMIGAKQGSNTNGAILTIDGEALINPIPIQLQPRESKTFVLSVMKGPDVNAYTYNDIGIFAASLCQYQHSLGLGYNLAAYADYPANNDGKERPLRSENVMEGPYNIVDLEKFYKQFFINVEFQEPCSPINIGFPFQDWVQTPAMGDNLVISLNSYINNDPDLELIRVQYRRTGGDGAWINIVDVPKSELAGFPVSKNITWDMSSLADGPYEIRAVSICFSGLNPGVSAVIRGRKETRPPRPFGIPSPADGVLNPGDEISITFSKRINCDKVFPADGIGTNINLNNMALQDMTLGGILIDADFICRDEKIIIIPRVSRRFIENHTLRVTATDIEDLFGNKADQVVWEFFVNQSNLFWHGGDINEVVLEGNELIVRREIRNQSGERTSFLIEEFPNWMQIFPIEGSLDPGQIIPVSFVFPADLVNGAYSTTVQMKTIDGDEPMKVDLRVACQDPNWFVDPSAYSFSMNIAAQLNIEGELSSDRLDIIGAYVGNELRGIGRVQFSRDLNKFLVFLTIYSNQATGETVTFKIWDASDCQLYGTTLESFPFVADGLIGSPLEPQIIHTNGQIERKIYLNPGWNWISYNINLTNPSTNSALSSLTNPTGGLIKSQTAFSTYSTATNSWLGSLNALSHLRMYQYNSQLRDSLLLLGTAIDQTTPIPLNAGWNWIGYLPQYGLPTTQALASLSPQNGDIVKSQISFAQYVAGVGWIGNLNFMSSPNGYLIRLSQADVLSYPARNIFNANGDSVVDDQRKMGSNLNANQKTHAAQMVENLASLQRRWTVDPQKFEHNMNAIGVVVDENLASVLHEGAQVAAFVGSELRGVGEVISVSQLNESFIFLTAYANRDGEVMTLRYFDAQTGEELDIQERLIFQTNQLLGSIDAPTTWTLFTTTSTNEPERSGTELLVYPNPATDKVYLNFNTQQTETVQVEISDLMGRKVYQTSRLTNPGQNIIEWLPTAGTSSGMYIIRLIHAAGSVSSKLELIRQ